MRIGVDDARQKLVLRIIAGGLRDHALVFAQLVVEQQRIVPGEDGLFIYAHKLSSGRSLFDMAILARAQGFALNA